MRGQNYEKPRKLSRKKRGGKYKLKSLQLAAVLIACTATIQLQQVLANLPSSSFAALCFICYVHFFFFFFSAKIYIYKASSRAAFTRYILLQMEGHKRECNTLGRFILTSPLSLSYIYITCPRVTWFGRRRKRKRIHPFRIVEIFFLFTLFVVIYSCAFALVTLCGRLKSRCCYVALPMTQRASVSKILIFCHVLCVSY